MIMLFFRSAGRSLLRYRQFSLINLIGLTLGFSAVMALSNPVAALRAALSNPVDSLRME